MDSVAVGAMDIHRKFSKALAIDGRSKGLEDRHIKDGDREGQDGPCYP